MDVVIGEGLDVAARLVVDALRIVVSTLRLNDPGDPPIHIEGVVHRAAPRREFSYGNA